MKFNKSEIPRNFINKLRNMGDTISGQLGVLTTSTKMRSLLLVGLGAFAVKSMGQTNPSFPQDNINALKYRFFNATGENLVSSLNEQVSVNEKALNNDLTNRELSIAYRITTMSAADYTRVFIENNLSETNFRFFRWVHNIDPATGVPGGGYP